MEPVSENGKLSYRYHGKIDFVGDKALGRTDGAGGPIESALAFEFCLPIAARSRSANGYNLVQNHLSYAH